MERSQPEQASEVVLTMEHVFRDRREAGRELAHCLSAYSDRPDVVVFALPRGGVPVGYEIAQALRVPLDVMIVRKLGVPSHEELAMGAIASGNIRVLNDEVIRQLKIPDAVIDQVSRQEHEELLRRERAYRGSRPSAPVEGRTVMLVDDGLATGSTMRAAIAAVRQRQPAKIVVAVPTAAPEPCQALRAEASDVNCLTSPTPFFGVGQWYVDFSQTSDQEVRALLDRAAALVGR